MEQFRLYKQSFGDCRSNDSIPPGDYKPSAYCCITHFVIHNDIIHFREKNLYVGRACNNLKKQLLPYDQYIRE